MELHVEDARLRDLLKQAVLEAIDERREFLRSIIDEEIEDILLGKLIERDKDSGLVSEERIMQMLSANHAG